MTLQAFDYHAFIIELIPMVAEAKAFDAKDRHEGSDAFRAWRYKILDLLTRIQRLRYSVNCDVNVRTFHINSYNAMSEQRQRERFDRDLKDTIVELEHVIAVYEKYGDPNAAKAATSARTAQSVLLPAMPPIPAELPPPDKVTFHWLWKHMSISAWGTLLALILGAFAFGTTVGASPAVQFAIASFGQAKSAATPGAPERKP